MAPAAHGTELRLADPARAAQTAGGRRLVARRYAASRETKRIAAAMGAWRAAVSQTRLRRARRFRATEVASRKARVRATRLARDARAEGDADGASSPARTAFVFQT